MVGCWIIRLWDAFLSAGLGLVWITGRAWRGHAACHTQGVILWCVVMSCAGCHARHDGQGYAGRMHAGAGRIHTASSTLLALGTRRVSPLLVGLPCLLRSSLAQVASTASAR